jgi:hypothetical protein
MLFRRKSKDGSRAGRTAGGRRKTATSGSSAKSAKAQAGKGNAPANAAKGAKRDTATTAKATKAAKAGKDRQSGGRKQQSRAEAEQQIMRMMSDGSLDKVKTMLRAQDPKDVVDEYPEQTVDAIRNWLNERDK